MINPFKKFLHPEKYKEKIEISKIVASPKLYKKGVEKYKEKILSGETIKPIVVLKHPHEDYYAVLDGHHRFYAYYELGSKELEVAVIRTRTKFLFNRTKDGWLQPTPRMTKFVHIPAIVLSKYINSFVKNPRKILAARKSLPRLNVHLPFRRQPIKTA
jgi:uncharacterized ParB-like nuclease family protein